MRNKVQYIGSVHLALTSGLECRFRLSDWGGNRLVLSQVGPDAEKELPDRNGRRLQSPERPPVKEPPNEPQGPPVEEPEDPPEPPPPPSHPPVKEPPDEPGEPPVKEPPPEDPDRQPPQPPPMRTVPDSGGCRRGRHPDNTRRSAAVLDIAIKSRFHNLLRGAAIALRR